MSVKVSVSDGVTSWQKLSSFSKINSIVWEWFITSSAINYSSTYEIFGSTWSNWWTERLNLSKNVRILIQSLLTKRSKIVKGTLFIEVVLEYELGGNSTLLIFYSLWLVFIRFHWWHWSWFCLHCHAWCHSILTSEHWHWILTTKCLRLRLFLMRISCEWIFEILTN